MATSPICALCKDVAEESITNPGWTSYRCARCGSFTIDDAGMAFAANLTAKDVAPFVLHYRRYAKMEYTQLLIAQLMGCFRPESDEKKRDRLWDYITTHMTRGGTGHLNPFDSAIQGEIGAANVLEMRRLIDLLIPGFITAATPESGGTIRLAINGPIAYIQVGEAYYEPDDPRPASPAQ